MVFVVFGVNGDRLEIPGDDGIDNTLSHRFACRVQIDAPAFDDSFTRERYDHRGEFADTIDLHWDKFRELVGNGDVIDDFFDGIDVATSRFGCDRFI